jgi:hypothetical protein
MWGEGQELRPCTHPHPPPKPHCNIKKGEFMKNRVRDRYLILFIIISILSGPAYAQTVEESYRALKRIQSGVQTGIFYRDYLNLVAEARTKIELYLENPESKRQPKIAESISHILWHYNNAVKLWGIQFEQKGRLAEFLKKDSDMGKYIDKNYPEFVQFNNQAMKSPKKKIRDFYKKYYAIKLILKYGIWPKASGELDNLSKKLSQLQLPH